MNVTMFKAPHIHIDGIREMDDGVAIITIDASMCDPLPTLLKNSYCPSHVLRGMIGKPEERLKKDREYFFDKRLCSSSRFAVKSLLQFTVKVSYVHLCNVEI